MILPQANHSQLKPNPPPPKACSRSLPGHHCPAFLPAGPPSLAPDRSSRTFSIVRVVVPARSITFLISFDQFFCFDLPTCSPSDVPPIVTPFATHPTSAEDLWKPRPLSFVLPSPIASSLVCGVTRPPLTPTSSATVASVRAAPTKAASSVGGWSTTAIAISARFPQSSSRLLPMNAIPTRLP